MTNIAIILKKEERVRKISQNDFNESTPKRRISEKIGKKAVATRKFKMYSKCK